MAFVQPPFSFRFLDPYLDFNKLDVGFKQAGCRMSDFLQVGCRILTSWMSDFYKSDVNVGFFEVGCRMAPISFRLKGAECYNLVTCGVMLSVIGYPCSVHSSS